MEDESRKAGRTGLMTRKRTFEAFDCVALYDMNGKRFLSSMGNDVFLYISLSGSIHSCTSLQRLLLSELQTLALMPFGFTHRTYDLAKHNG